MAVTGIANALDVARAAHRSVLRFLAVVFVLGLPAFTWAAPTALNQTITMMAGQQMYYFELSFSDLLSPTNFTILSQPTNGTLVSYDSYYGTTNWPSSYFYSAGSTVGTDSFTWKCSDILGVSGVATCTVVITSGTPVAYNQTVNVGLGQQAYFALNFGGIPTNFTILSQPTNGTLLFYGNTMTSAGVEPNYYRYTAGSNAGTDSFTWQCNNSWSTSGVATCSIVIAVVPIAYNATNDVLSGEAAFIDLGFDDPMNGIDTFTIVSPPSNGFLQVVSGDEYRYTSNPGFVGTDTFTWVVNNGYTNSTAATETVVVQPSLPIPESQSACVPLNTPVTIQPLYMGGGGYTCTPVRVSGPSHGTLVLSGNSFVYTPTANYVGADSFIWKINYSNATTPPTNSVATNCAITVVNAGTNADWTQWRFNECRTAQTPMPLPNNLYLQWRVDVPTCVDSFQGNCNDIDNCRPVQLGKQLFVSLMANDSVSAYNTDTGALNWRYYASGALRRPPVAVALTNGTNVVIFGCDDGTLYCLNAANGSELWKFRGAPNSKQAMVFGRLGSVWPVWGSPVVYSNRVYFVAGYLPTWGLFAYCLDAASGSVIWFNNGGLKDNGYNTSLGPLSLSYDHTEIFGTVEGYDTPWILSTATGGFIGHTGHPMDKSDCLNPIYIQPVWYIDGSGVNAMTEPQNIVANGQTFTPSSVAALGVPGTVANMLAGDGKLFVTTTGGSVYCFGGAQPATTNIYPLTTTPLPATNDVWTTVVSNMLSRPDLGEGLALVWGVGSGRLVEELAKQGTNLMIVVVDPDPVKLRNLRVEMDAAGWSGARVATLQGNPTSFRFAPYQAALIASEDVNVAGYSNGLAMVQAMYNASRPFGGQIWLPTSNAQYSAIAGWLTTANLPTCGGAASYSVANRTDVLVPGVDGFTQIQRLGLPDSALTFKPPFRVTAFGISWRRTVSGGTLNPTPVYGKNSATRGVKSGYDIYSWLPVADIPPGYEPPQPTGSNTLRSVFVSGNAPMVNPVNNRMEIPPPVWKLKSCEENFGYGNLQFSPGKQGAIVDTANYWGVFLIPELRGCIHAGGAICFACDGIADFAPDGCGCNCVAGMTLTQLGVVPVTDQDEEYFVGYQWSRSQESIQEAPVRRIGINFGAPDQRYDSGEGLLWTHHPSASSMLVPGFTQLGQAIPVVPVTYQGGVTSVYHNSVVMSYTNPANHNWVSASYVEGMNGITIPLAAQLVATRVATPPVMDGTLNDACWGTSNCVYIVPGGGLGTHHQTSPSDTAYVMARYDATNLYIGAGLCLQDSLLIGVCSFQIVLNSREKTVPPVALGCGSAGKRTQGIDSNAWQAAYTLVPSGTNYNRFQAEMAIPWSALAAAGIWKEQLTLNANFIDSNGYSPSLLNGTIITGFAPTLNNWPSALEASSALITDANMSPVFLDSARGVTTNASPYTVRLYFSEMEGLTNGQRVFDVSLQGQTVLTNFDVYATAGTGACEVVEIFTNILIADHLNIGFVPHSGTPMLSGAAIIDTYTNANGSHINPPGIPPVAVISNSVTSGPAPLSVTLSARSSYAPDGQIVDCAWETGDNCLAKGSLIQHVFAEPGVYTVNLLVMDNSGATATTNATITVTSGAPSAFICNIRATGGDYTNLTSWQTAIAGDLTAANALLFTVTNLGTYASSTDDGHAVTFTGGGSGVLRHINTAGIAYITNCTGTIQSGVITLSSGHTFTVADTGSPICSAVASCYNDWPTTGLSNNFVMAGWNTASNHCVTIRAAPGQGHMGKLRQGSNYSGFTIAGKGTGMDCSSTPYVRIERIALDNGSLLLGYNASANRVVATNTISAYGSNAVVANSIAGTFVALKWGGGVPVDFVSYYNCTGRSFTNNASASTSATHLRYVNCLSATGGAGFGANVGYCFGLLRSHCVSVDTTATNAYLSEYLLNGNQATQAVSFVAPASGDFRLAATDAGANGKAGPGLGADVAGNARIAPTYAAGAYQPTPPGPQITSGPVATPNPTTTTTATSFSVQATDSNTMTYAWTFGDGGSANATTATYTYAASGVYTAQVVVSDGQYAATGSVAVTVSQYAPPVANLQTVNVLANTTNNSIALSYTYASMGTQSLLWTMTVLPTNGTLNYWSGSSYLPVSTGIGLATNSVYYTPSVSPTGSDSFCWFLSDGITSSAPATCSILINSNAASVVTNHLNVSTAGTGTGNVTLSPPGGSYTAGTAVTLTAIPGTNSTFTGWSGALSGVTNPATLTMNGNYSVTANFGLSFPITASAGANGSISPSGTVSVAAGGSQTFTITPATYYAINSVTVDGSPVAPASYTFSNVQTNHAISATFYAKLAPLGTPLWWLAQYGYASELALDPNGVPVWKDYLLNINPNSPGTGPSYNIVPYGEGFENLNAWGGVYTNVVGSMGWYSSAPGVDQSAIVNLIYTNIFTNLPLPSITHTNVLQLNANGAILSNSFGSGFSMSNSLVYMDLMMQFGGGGPTPSSYTLTDNGIKGGFYLNTNRQFTVYHGVASSLDGTLLSNTLDATSVTLSSGTWHRVTWMVDATATNPANALAMFQVCLDGTAVSHANAYNASWKTQFQNAGTLPLTSATGTWFRFATTNAWAKTLTALYFVGTGYLDDVAVTTNNPFALLSGPYLLIITSSGPGCSSLGSGPYLSAVLSSGANTQIVYTAAEWNRISTLASNGVPLITAVGARSFTQQVLNISANISNAVSFAWATQAQTGYTNVPTSWLTNWTEEAIHGAQGCDGFCVHDKYILGLDPTSSNSYRLVIEGCSPSGSNVVIVVRRDVSGLLASNGMGGSLILQATPSMTNAFTNLPAAILTGPNVFDATGHRSYTNTVDHANKYYKAIVQ